MQASETGSVKIRLPSLMTSETHISELSLWPPHTRIHKILKELVSWDAVKELSPWLHGSVAVCPTMLPDSHYSKEQKTRALALPCFLLPSLPEFQR